MGRAKFSIERSSALGRARRRARGGGRVAACTHDHVHVEAMDVIDPMDEAAAAPTLNPVAGGGPDLDATGPGPAGARHGGAADGGGGSNRRSKEAARQCRADVSEALRGMRDGSVTEDETAEMLERLVAARIAVAREDQPPAGIFEGTTSVIARLGTAPTNCAQLDRRARSGYAPVWFPT
eukprot:SAG31_NODE_1254_length_9087_cov_12.553071_7_plen_180_part_00